MNEFRIPTHNKRYPRRTVNRLAFMVIVLTGILGVVMYSLRKMPDELAQVTLGSRPEYLPDPVLGEIYHKPNFSLSYVEQYEVPEWVSYTLTVDMMNKPKHERNQDFNPDPDIRSGSAHYHDYKSSGYRRGHLVPSADMAWDKKSMDATFLLSNVVPMRAEFNDGIWLELEQNVRDWSRRYKHVTVVAGPVFEEPVSTIGDNEVLVPRYFYKAVFTVHEGKPYVIGFLFNQTDSAFTTLDEYVVPVDRIEKMTGLDLFANLYGSWDTEIELEGMNDVPEGTWPFNDRWYQQRMKE